jgi:hypothetical protein
VIYTKQFYILFFTDFSVSFFAYLSLLIVTSQLNTIFDDANYRYIIFSAILGGSVALQPVIGYLFDFFQSLRIMNFINIAAMSSIAFAVSALGV